MILQDEFLTVTEVAAMLKVTTFTVYSWLNEGKLRGYKAGEGWRIKKEDIETFLKSNQAG